MPSFRLTSLLAAAAAIALPTAAVHAETSAPLTLEQRVLQLEAEKEIREVIVKYGEYLDARNYAGYASLFASDGMWTGGFGSATGPAAIEEMLEKNLGEPEPGFINKTSFHLNTTIVVHVEGDEATARSRYLFITAVDETKPNVLLAGRYVDQFKRENGAWKIYRRTSHGVIPYRDGNAPPPAQQPAGLQEAIKP